MDEEYPYSMNTEQAARYLRMSVGKLKWLVRRNRIHVIRFYTGWIFERPELDRWSAEEQV